MNSGSDQESDKYQFYNLQDKLATKTKLSQTNFNFLKRGFFKKFSGSVDRKKGKNKIGSTVIE